MKYLFILGRNEELSIAEIKAYLENIENPIHEMTVFDNGLMVEVSDSLDDETINFLGGTISIGKVLATGTDTGIFEKINDIMIYEGTNNKLNYTLWDFSEFSDQMNDYLKKRFKSEKLKAVYKGLTGRIKMQDGEIEARPSSKLLDEEYFVFHEEGLEHFGKIIQKCNYGSIENRDMNKPVRRESLAIAPRLAKIMINLAKLEAGDTLLDPFCGVGTVLQEALLQGINVVGVDRDEKAIKGAKENMKWFKFNPENYKLINRDSTHVEIPKVNAIATEPDLGTILKKIPTKAKAKETLLRFSRLMINVLNNVKENVSGRVVFTTPYIRIGKKRLSCNIDDICEKTGYSLIQDGIEEYRHNQVVGRMIYILEK
jgi:tRNA G10  N-methylase Trm11